MSKENILNKLKKSVLNYDGEAAKEAAKEALEAGIDPIEAIQQGLYSGLKELCDEYERTVYITDMVLASDAFYEGANVLKSNITPEKAKSRKKGVAIIGVSEGDVHDLGKNIVKYLMEAEGFEMIDLGFDVKVDKFIEEAEKQNADLIMISLMLSSMFPEIGKLVNSAKVKGLKDKGVKIMAGGGPVTEEVAKQYGADGWALTAPEAVKKALELLNIE
jgi:methanogenic corrinoid protein MtbC1